MWQPIEPGHVFLDLTGTTRLYGSGVDAALLIEREITRQHGVMGAVGNASNKSVSRVAVATVRTPPECRDVKPGRSGRFSRPPSRLGSSRCESSRCEKDSSCPAIMCKRPNPTRSNQVFI